MYKERKPEVRRPGQKPKAPAVQPPEATATEERAAEEAPAPKKKTNADN
jgi:hypothetical protein